MKKLIKWIIIILLAVIGVKAFNNFVNPETKDISYLAAKNKSEIQSELGCTFTPDAGIAKRVYVYTKGELTADSNSQEGISILYIDGEQVGIHTDNRIYSMFNIAIGDAIISVQSNTTFTYDDHFEVLDDLYGGSSTATFYYNSTSGECLVVIANDTTNRVVALTYYKDGRRATEMLEKVF